MYLVALYLVEALGMVLGYLLCLQLNRAPKFKTGDRVKTSADSHFYRNPGRVEHIRWNGFQWSYYVIWDSGGDGYYYAEKLERC